MESSNESREGSKKKQSPLEVRSRRLCTDLDEEGRLRGRLRTYTGAEEDTVADNRKNRGSRDQVSVNTVFPSQEADEDRPQCGYAIRRYRTELNLDDCECTEAGNNLREEDCGSLRNRKSDQRRDAAQERTGACGLGPERSRNYICMMRIWSRG